MKFRSGLEEKVADLLGELEYLTNMNQLKYLMLFSILTRLICILPSGVMLECKGYWDTDDRRKIKAVKTLNPDLDLRMVFQAPYNTISKKSKTTYAQYCERLNIPWTSFHNIPLEWLT